MSANDQAGYSVVLIIEHNFMDKAFPLLLIMLLSSCEPSVTTANDDCGFASNMARNNQFEAAITKAHECLGSNILENDDEIWGHRALAWSYYNLSDFSKAADVQRKVLSLSGRTYHDLINGGLFFRRINSLEESLNILNEAEEHDEKHDQVSMMTQYQLGWTLLELGRYELEIEAFTSGIPYQQDFAFVYYRRGLAYYSLELKEEAKLDFFKFNNLLTSEIIDPSSRNELIDQRELLISYGVDISPFIE